MHAPSDCRCQFVDKEDKNKDVVVRTERSRFVNDASTGGAWKYMHSEFVQT